jgi:hypothetical protein
MVTTMANIVNNAKLNNVFFNLWYRWQDEYEYEDINDYGKVLHETLAKEFPNDGFKLTASTKRPFGIKVKDNVGRHFHIYIKRKGNYASMVISQI